MVLLVFIAGCALTSREITRGTVTPGPTGPTGAVVYNDPEPLIEEQPEEEPEENLLGLLPPGLHQINYPIVRLGDIEVRDRGAKKISDTQAFFEILILNYGSEEAAIKVHTYVYFQSNMVASYENIIKHIKPGKAKYNYTIDYTSYWNAFTLALENP